MTGRHALGMARVPRGVVCQRTWVAVVSGAFVAVGAAPSGTRLANGVHVEYLNEPIRVFQLSVAKVVGCGDS